MTTALLIKGIDGAWRPADETAWNTLGKFPVGVPCLGDIKDPSRRSNRQNSFWHAMAGELFKGQSLYTDYDHFRQCLLIRLGYCEWYEQKDGSRVPVAKSQKFGKMSADEFGALVDATLDFAVEMGWSRDELLAQTRDFVGAAA